MKRRLIPICMLALALVSLAVALVAGVLVPGASASGPAVPGDSQPAAPEAIESLVTPVARPGNYAAFDYTGLEAFRFALDGSLVVFNWSDVEIQQDVYDWSPIDEWLELQSALGKASIIGISTYNGRCCGGVNALPAYLRDDPDVVWTSYLGHKIPRYWRDEYLEPYQRFIAELGGRYKDDPRVEAVATGLGMYGESAAWKPDENDAANALGEVTVWVWIETVKKITDYYVAAFSDQGRLQKVLLNQTAPYTYNSSERRNIAEYSVSKGVGLSINGLYPDSENLVRGETGEPGSRYTGMYDQALRYDPACALEDPPCVDTGTGLPVPLAWETYDYMIGCDDGVSVYWAMLNGLDKHPQYMRLHVDLLHEAGENGYGDVPLGPDKTEQIDIFRWVQPYLGATVDNTPSVWVAMRDARAPWQTCWQSKLVGTPYQEEFYPQYGNYDFWLYQFDNIAGGQTVVETNTCTTYSGIPLTKPTCNSNLPDGPEGWVIRRTNEPTNPYMFFDVDDAYIHGGTNSITVTVTYWDNATDTWSLYYDSTTGEKAAVPQGSSNPYVQKTGSDTYRKAVFVIDDAQLAEEIRGRADFYIDSNDDGNEWIHLVDLTNGDWTPVWEVPTPTPTLTATPTSTPTVTPTPRPDTGRVYGLVFDDLNENAQADAGEPPVSGALVELLEAGSTVVMSRETGADGRYDFQSVVPGPYVLRESDPPGYRSIGLGQIAWEIKAGTVLEWNFADRQLPTATPTHTPTVTPTPTRTPTTGVMSEHIYVPLVLRVG